MDNKLLQSQTPRLDSIEFFLRIISNHSKINSIEQIEVPLFSIKKDNNDILRALLVDIYIIGDAEVLDLMSRYSGIDAIINISMWNKNTKSAKDMAREQEIGLFEIKEFMGALNCVSRKAFLNYIPPNEREENKKRNKPAF
ncbi:hypothetical protein [Bacillus velezensis]|uniref:hypothetical protein n=1 Tax=Bacillus velezensis TaxID=492670 RepID=UPI0039F6A7CA